MEVTRTLVAVAVMAVGVTPLITLVTLLLTGGKR